MIMALVVIKGTRIVKIFVAAFSSEVNWPEFYLALKSGSFA